MRSVPHSCPRCRAEGSYYGILVFGDAEAPKCPYHKNTTLEPSGRVVAPVQPAPEREGTCSECGKSQPLSALLYVTSLWKPAQTRAVCRPGVEGNDPGCFRRGTCYNGHHVISV